MTPATLQGINHELKKVNLPTSWVQINEEPVVLCQLMFTSDEAAEVYITIIIYSDLSWKCCYYDKEVKTSSFITSLPSMIKDATMIPQLITNLTQAQVCIGNHDKNFISMSAERNGRFMSTTGNTTAIAPQETPQQGNTKASISM